MAMKPSATARYLPVFALMILSYHSMQWQKTGLNREFRQGASNGVQDTSFTSAARGTVCSAFNDAIISRNSSGESC